MTPEQVGLYQAVLDNLLASQTSSADEDSTARKGHVLAAITHLKQICDHPAAYLDDDDGAARRAVRQAGPPRGADRGGVRGR